MMRKVIGGILMAVPISAFVATLILAVGFAGMVKILAGAAVIIVGVAATSIGFDLLREK